MPPRIACPSLQKEREDQGPERLEEAAKVRFVFFCRRHGGWLLSPALA
jgi:hypothetical protein